MSEGVGYRDVWPHDHNRPQGYNHHGGIHLPMTKTYTTNLSIPDDICDTCRPELQELANRPAHPA